MRVKHYIAYSSVWFSVCCIVELVKMSPSLVMLLGALTMSFGHRFADWVCSEEDEHGCG